MLTTVDMLFSLIFNVTCWLWFFFKLSSFIIDFQIHLKTLLLDIISVSYVVELLSWGACNWWPYFYWFICESLPIIYSENRSEATPVRRSASTEGPRHSASDTSPPSVKDRSPTELMPARRTSRTSSLRQQTATSPVQSTTRNSTDSKHGNVQLCTDL